MLSDKPFRKEDLDLYLRELAKEFRKRNGKAIPAEITLIGGASIPGRGTQNSAGSLLMTC